MQYASGEIELYEILKAKIGEKEAKSVITLVETKVDKKFEEQKDILATKRDISDLRAEILRTIYLVSLGQIIAIIASVIAIINYIK